MALTKLTSNLIEGGTGTDWVTAIQTSNFTAAAGKGYFVNTTSQVLYVNLPVGVVGMEITIQDYAGTFATNKVILNANGSEKIQGSALEGQITTNNATAVLIYQDATKGWTSQDISLIPTNFNAYYLVVAGGGGGAGSYLGAGGGAGGLRATTTYGGSEAVLNLVAATNYTITVGAGGAGGQSPSGDGTGGIGGDGNNSVFSPLPNTNFSTGGGGGGAYSGFNYPGRAGGSGGGAAYNLGVVGAGVSGEGFSGGSMYGAGTYSGGGGGGAQEAGNTNGQSAGGDGKTINITGSSLLYAGGGGGAGVSFGGAGGAGGGGAGSGDQGVAGTPNTGGGGGGSERATSVNKPGGAGGSGIVILRYTNSRTITNPGSGLTFTTATVSTDKVTTFTAGTGNIQFN